jgi:sodium/pantothenate symporter
MVASMAIGMAANRSSERGGFLKGFFLGNRSLGAWAMALTATVMSGGTFMGFPSLVYQYGWVLALWIASYMMVPLCTFAILGKPIGRLARKTGAITLPDLLRERFQSPTLGLVASGVMVFILCVNLVAQFKGGAIVLQKVLPSWVGFSQTAQSLGGQSPAFLCGLTIFTVVVVSYTVYGGFLAAVWTDVFQSILMAVGVLILLPLALIKSGGLEAGTLAGVQAAGPGYAFAPGAGREFLPLSLAFSFFCMWSITGMGQPATLVRLMAFRDTKTLRHATIMLAVYNTLIYLPLVCIFICARAILPDLQKPDEVMPTMALTLASPWVAGLILAAPFGAVMATVSAFLVQISSAFVQDFFHRFIDPNPTERTLRVVTQASIVMIALVVAVATVFSPPFLQVIIVFAGGTAGCAFLMPAIMAALWPRSTSQGAMAAMLGGFTTMVGLYVLGWMGGDPGIGEKGKYYPFYLLGLAPYVWGLVVSAVLGVVVSLVRPNRTPQAEDVEEALPAT